MKSAQVIQNAFEGVNQAYEKASEAVEKVSEAEVALLKKAMAQTLRFGERALVWGKRNPQTVLISAVAVGVVIGVVVRGAFSKTSRT